MKTHPHYLDWSESVAIPVKRVGGRWEFFYGGDVPAKDGAIGELKISSAAIEDAKFRERVTQEAVVRILDEGAVLRVALSDPSCRSSAVLKDFPFGLPPGVTRVEEIRLGPPKKKALKETAHQLDIPETQERGGLWLKVKGLECCELQGSTIKMPDEFGVNEAQSLNHAYTLLSERYETHRLAHTGNVYQRVFYQDKDQLWYPLNDLRQGVLVSTERKLLADTWQVLEQQLGWRPMTSLNDKKAKK